MELDDLKNLWNEENRHITTQPTSTFQSRNNKRKYRSKLKKITVPELIGSIVCLAGALFIVFRFHQLNTTVLKIAGITAGILLLLLPALSAWSTWQLRQTDELSKPYIEALSLFALRQTRFVKLQRVNATLSYLLLVAVIVLMSKFSGGMDIYSNRYFWIFSFTIGYIFLMFYSKWVSKYYRNTLREAEALLNELGR